MSGTVRTDAHIVVLSGGISDEREISLASGAAVVSALHEAGYSVVDELDPAADTFLADLASGGFDVAFIALHGRGGEDGMIQSVLEYMGIPYTGSRVIASACAADKDVSKALFERAGIPIARGMVLHSTDDVNIDDIVGVVGEQCFVKPAVNGSSYGVTLVKSERDIPAALEVAFDCDDKALIEERLVGTEISVPVFGDEPRALPIIEILPQEGSDFYDLEVKYIDPALVHRIPAQLDEDTYRYAQELAVQAHEALGCAGFSRSDFIITSRGPVILETNTIPGMTPTSLFPDSARHAGISFPEVCDELIQIAMRQAHAQ